MGMIGKSWRSLGSLLFRKFTSVGELTVVISPL
jgi:hypothetical protein